MENRQYSPKNGKSRRPQLPSKRLKSGGTVAIRGPRLHPGGPQWPGTPSIPDGAQRIHFINLSTKMDRNQPEIRLLDRSQIISKGSPGHIM